jgi:oligosaccharide repeat unit polymerase
MYNKIIAIGWLSFFFLGILNINSVNAETNYYNLQLHDASLFYLICLIAFFLCLMFFEKSSAKKDLAIKINTHKKTSFPFLIILFIYPFALFISVFKSVGFLPILSGSSFVDSMYEYNYGPLYGFKFICVYGFLLAVVHFSKGKNKLIITAYILFLLFAISIDGKRLVLLLCLLAFIPVYNWILKQNNKTVTKKTWLIPFLLVFIIYVLINGIRTGSNVSELATNLLIKIPFGVEYKDYVHSFNTYKDRTIPGYNFELSAIGSFFNSSLLNLAGENKETLTKMGSAYTWMDLYDIKFGIRTGIISELYFAYGYFTIVLMAFLAFITNKISQRLSNPHSLFNLVQYSILFALVFLLINGQATVFFGCLSMMLYTFLFYKISHLKISNN